MSCSHVTQNLRFYIDSKVFSGSFILTFEPYIISRIEEEIDDFLYLRKKKIEKENLLIEKQNNGYHINVKAFIAICNIIFRVLKNAS